MLSTEVPRSDFRVSQDGTYIVARTIGEHTAASALADTQTLVELFKTTGIMKVLIDGRAQKHVLSTLPAFHFAESLEPLGLSRYQFAVVVEADLKEAWFAETTLINRGIRARFFNDYDQALAWLKVTRDDKQD